ncbi:MAG: HAD family hydrolase [Deltaproteobacteria bacterium]|nr:HAD family hydrolase [Deltaproteobacteria bacterium]MBI2342312.1 HAD family hydrolase [Deltaproteobacteria bacterium]
MKRVCIFDFDGTIIDSMEEFADIAADVLNKHFGMRKELARKEYIKTSGLPFHDQIEIIHPKDARNSAAVNEYEETKKKTYLSKKPFDDAESTITRLKNSGIKTVVSSNNFQELVDDLINKTAIKFDMVLGWRKNFSKGRDHFEHVRKTFDCKPEDMTFIGDSLKDADRAKEYGINFIGKTGTFNAIDFEKHCGKVPTINALNDLIKTLQL